MDFLRLLEDARTPFFDSIMSAVTHLGSETLFFVIGLAVFWCASKAAGYYLLTVGYCSLVANQFLKLICRVARPWVRDPGLTPVESALADAGGFSFPSGHTANITATAGSVARYWKNTWLRIACVAAIALTAFSRMYLGVHTPWDVGASLAISLALAFGLYPVFKDAEKHPNRIIAALAALIALSVGFTIYASTRVAAAEEAELINDAVKNGYSMCGAGVAMLMGFIIERKYIKFDARAVWWAQLIKLAVGLMLVLGIKELLKSPLNSLFGGHMIAHSVRYFIIVMFATGAWPLTFRWFAKMGGNRK